MAISSSEPETKETTAGERSQKTRQILTSVAILLFSILISVGGFLLRGEIQGLSSLGYVGVLVISILANATLIVPAPASIAFTFAATGAGLNPLLVGLLAGLGSAVGELVGYMAGYAGHSVIENRGFYNRIFPLIKKWGAVAIFVLAVIPTPLFDVGGMAAGALKMPFWVFFLSCWAGKTVRMVLVAYAGVWTVPLFGKK